MTTFINYAIQANLVLLFFLFAETIFFKGEKTFTARRFFLLAGIVVAMSIHLLKHIIASLQIETLKFSVALAPVTVSYSIKTENLSIEKILEILYFAGVAILSFHLFKQFLQLFRALNKPYTRWNDLRVYESEHPHHVFSFFRLVSIGSHAQFSAWEKNKILQHELVHAQRWHSFDILLISLIQILFWFNPLLYFYKRKLIQLHEFEADARSVQSEEVDLYCSLLAKVALQSTGFTLANHFTQSFTLNRIIIMKSMNKKMQAWKIAMTAFCTILFLGIVCFYEPVRAQEKSLKAQESNSQEQVFDQVDEIPTYPEGFDGLVKFMGKEMKYPKAAKQAGLQGTTIVSFVVEKDGTLSAITLKKGFNKECDEEALRVMKSMSTKWIPGKKSGKLVRTLMVIPINFKL